MSIRLLTSWQVKIGLLVLLWLPASMAQATTHIVPDRTLGTEVTQRGNVHEITGGTRSENGANLFHSFAHFNVGTGNTAHFIGPDVDNIVGRVTGGTESVIDGRLQADANLFLLNPYGMMFGPNATLDIKGSFHGSTADVLRFEDGGEFAVDISEQSRLSIAAPSAFGFVNANPNAITIKESQLSVPERETLSLVGGGIEITGGNLRAPSGQINLVSVASAGDVVFDGMRLDTTALAALGPVSITGSQLEASGRARDQEAGLITIRGGQLKMAQSLIRVTNRSNRDGGGLDVEVDGAITIKNTDILSDTLGEGQGGHITLRAKALTIDQETLIRSNTFGAGSGGHITLAVETLVLMGDAVISSTSPRNTAAGASGNITIHGRDGQGTAARSVTIRDSTLSTEVAGQGDGGTITITANAVDLHSANLTAATTGAGTAGNITLNVSDLRAMQRTAITSNSAATATGDAGHVTIQGLSEADAAAKVTLTDSVLRTSTDGSGAGGTIIIMADTVDLSNTALTATTRGAGNAGDITLNVAHLSATQQSTITTSSGRDTGISGSVTIQGLQGDGSMAQTVILDDARIRNETSSSSQTQGGDILVVAESLGLTNQSELRSNTFRAGPGGRIALRAGTLIIDSSSLIQSDTFGTGRGGAIELAVDNLTLTGNAAIGSNSRRGATGDAGTITIHGRGGHGTAAHEVTLHDSTLQTNTDGEGTGGTITVTANAVDLTQANLTATTAGAGRAGAITLNVNRLNATAQTLITSSSTESATGDAGRVTIQGLGGADTEARVVALDNSAVRTQAASDQANGGAIQVHAQRLQLRSASAIRSDTNQGQRGGDIDLDAALVVMANSEIIANSEAAQEKAAINISGALITDINSVVQASGGVSIFGSVFDLSGAVQLSLAFLQQAALLPQRCSNGLRGSQASRFVLAGRDGLPLEPGRLLLSNLALEPYVQAPKGQRPQAQIEAVPVHLPAAWHIHPDCDKLLKAR